MQKLDFTFFSSPAHRLSRWWLLLGGISLAIAGLFSLALIIGRSPGLSSLPFFVNLFHVSIAVHVDLSVLAWFLCIACLMWSLFAANKPPLVPFLEEAALLSMGAGIALIAVSPFDAKAVALMSNYIPVITTPVFFFGLALILCSVTLMAGRAILFFSGIDGLISLAVYSSAIIALAAVAAFIASHHFMPPGFDGEPYYELLFWGGGHVLQFLHVQILLVVWLFLVTSIKYQVASKLLLATRYSLLATYLLFLIGPLAALLTPLGYLSGDVSSFAHRQFFTHMMIFAGGIAPAILALMIIPAVWRARGERKKENRALWSALAMSILLFICGGVLGGMIQGQNVVIPAHYHGSIIGITLAFMGMAYALLPVFGYRRVVHWKLAYWQPIVYCIGQLMHISGLAISGGYGVLRKTPGGFADVSTNVKIAMGFMGLGGLIAAIGGVMFVIVVARSVFYSKKSM
jgi:cytochrome c oxidase subunit I